MAKLIKKHWLLILIIFAALVVRFFNFPDDVYFSYDQSRDAYAAYDICSGNLKIQGPPTSRQGLFHGPLYWYALAPAYCLLGPSPLVNAAALRFFNLFSVVLIYIIGVKLFNKRIGLISAAVFAVSFENWQSALYFSNPGPATVTTLLFCLGMVYLIKDNKKTIGLILVSLGLGISIQLQFYLVYLFAVALIFTIVFRKKFFKGLKPKQVLIPVLVFIFLMSTYIVSEIKFNFAQTREFLNNTTEVSAVQNILYSLNQWPDRMSILFQDTFGLPSTLREKTPLISYILVMVSVVWSYLVYKRSEPNVKESLKVLFVWVLGSLILFVIGAHNFYYVVGISGGIVLLFTYLFSATLKSSWFYVLVIVIIAANLFRIYRYSDIGLHPGITVQTGMLLEKEKDVIDYIYADAEKNGVTEFVVSAFVMPYDIYTTWAYLFNSYAKPKYGYIPYWLKDMPEGFYGSVPVVDHEVCDRYVIYESTRGIENLEEQYIQDQDATSNQVFSKSFGEIKLEKRTDKICQ